MVRDAGPMGALLLIGTALVVISLVTAAAVLCVRRAWSRVATVAVVALAVVVAYGAVLVGVGVASPARSLSIGEWKCFDDWCAAVTSVHRSGDDVVVVVSVRNQGRRDQAPDTPRAWLVHGGHVDELHLPQLALRTPGGTTRELPEIRLVAPASEAPEFVISEGGFPSRLVIGDENSPFHHRSGWPLT